MLEPSNTAGPPEAGPAAYHGFARALSRMDPAWLILRDVALPCGQDEEASPSVRVDFALLHPHRGIALLDFSPKETPDAVERVRRALVAARFQAIFAGQLPVVYLRLAETDTDRLDGAVTAAFARDRAIGLRGGHAWTGLARRVLGGELASDLAPPGRGGQGHGPPDSPPEAAGHRSAPRASGFRALGYFWLAVLIVLAGGAAFLQFTYEPPSHAGPGAGAVRSGPRPDAGTAGVGQPRP